jgi:hypothetical protein
LRPLGRLLGLLLLDFQGSGGDAPQGLSPSWQIGLRATPCVERLQGANACAKQPGAQQCTVTAAKKQKTAVLCCCRTSGGGTCCANVAMCGGFVPGCFCSFGYRPDAPQLSSAK